MTWDIFLAEFSEDAVLFNKNKILYSLNGNTYSQKDFLKFKQDTAGIAKLRPYLDWITGLSNKEGIILLAKAVRDIIAPPASHARPHTETQKLQVGLKTRAELLQEISENCVLVNSYGPEPQFFLDYRTYNPYPMSIESILEIKRSKEFKDLLENSVMAKVFYRPGYKNTKEEIEKSQSISSYVWPNWRDVDSTSCEIDKQWVEFFEFFTPDPICRGFLYRWILRSITGINEQHLVLVGVEGVGKNVLCDGLLLNLHHHANYYKGKSNSLNTDFNGFLENKTLVFLDEQHIRTPLKVETLKSW